MVSFEDGIAVIEQVRADLIDLERFSVVQVDPPLITYINAEYTDPDDRRIKMLLDTLK